MKNQMKRWGAPLLLALAGIFMQLEMKALPAATHAIQSVEKEIAEISKSSNLQTDVSVKGLSTGQQGKLNKKAKKLENKLKKQDGKSKSYDDFSNVFGERYFILGTVFALSGIALAVLGAITSIGLFGLLGGIAVIVGLILIIIAILQAG